MTDLSKSKYQRAIDAAKSRGYDSPYAERKARSKTRGYSSPRTESTARSVARGTPRDYALERERASIRARGQGFLSTADKRAYRKAASTGDVSIEKWQKAKTLAHFGISERKFNAMRKANKMWAREYPMMKYPTINTYDTYRDRDVHNWSPDRVGYIVYFFAAVVDRSTNYESLVDKHGRRRLGKDGKPLTNKSQYFYLVKYGGIMQANEFETRYGNAVISG